MYLNIVKVFIVFFVLLYSLFSAHIDKHSWSEHMLRLKERAGIQPICFSVMWLLQSSLDIISRTTEPNCGDCIVSVGAGYKVTATAPSYKWQRGQMENTLWIFENVPFINANCSFPVQVTVKVMWWLCLPAEQWYTHTSHSVICNNTDGTNALCFSFFFFLAVFWIFFSQCIVVTCIFYYMFYLNPVLSGWWMMNIKTSFWSPHNANVRRTEYFMWRKEGWAHLAASISW